MILSPDNSIQVYRGSSKTVQITVLKTSSANSNPLGSRSTLPKAPAPVDLTGARAVMTIKLDALDPLPLFQKTTDNPAQAQIVNAKGGVLEFYLLPMDTAHLGIQPYVYDIWVQLLNGSRYPIVLPSVLELQAGVTTMF